MHESKYVLPLHTFYSSPLFYGGDTMILKNGNKYNSNYARAAAYFLGTCADRQNEASRASAYDFITGIYSAIMESPEKLGLKPTADIWLEPWEQQRERAKDVKIIRDSIKKIEALISELFKLITAAELCDDSLVLNENCAKPKKMLTAALRETGVVTENGKITLPEGCARGLKELADISAKNIIHITDNTPIDDKAYLYFSRCVFEPEENWTARVFDRGLGADGQLLWLCEELEKRGYKRIDCKDGKIISLDYVKQYGKKDGPVKMSWADKGHCGIELTFEDLRLEPYFIWLRMPEFKSVLEHCSEFPADVSDFIAKSTKTCDGCRYCIQTDKTGKRPLAAISVNNEMKCPYFPSFGMNWRFLDGKLAGDILKFIDTVYSN